MPSLQRLLCPTKCVGQAWDNSGTRSALKSFDLRRVRFTGRLFRFDIEHDLTLFGLDLAIQVADRESKVVRIRSIAHCNLTLDRAVADELLELAVKGLHSVDGAVAHRVDHRAAFFFTFFD